MSTANATALQMFEGRQVRTELAEDGSVLFCAKDVCEALAHMDHINAVKRHCLASGVVKRHLRSNGQSREMSFLTEGNMVRLVAKSKLPNARAFESWIFDTLVPTVLRTGEYVAPGKVEAVAPAVPVRKSPVRKAAGTPMDGFKLAAAMGDYLRRHVRGVSDVAVANRVITMASAQTGADFSVFREVLPAIEAKDAGILIASEVAAELGMKAAALNLPLAELGLQRRVGEEWRLTAEGERYAQVLEYTNPHNKHSGWQIRWKRSVLDVLRNPGDAIRRPSSAAPRASA